MTSNFRAPTSDFGTPLALQHFADAVAAVYEIARLLTRGPLVLLPYDAHQAAPLVVARPKAERGGGNAEVRSAPSRQAQ